jgi:hypothetical protein
MVVAMDVVPLVVTFVMIGAATVAKVELDDVALSVVVVLVETTSKS